MNTKRFRFVLFATLLLASVAALTIGASKLQLTGGGVIDPTCTSSLPCIEYDNNSTGPGMRGVSLLGNGVNGQTKFTSTSSSNGKTGVLGNDASTSGSFNIGVKGLSVRGIGVSGQSTSGDAVFGTSTNLAGVHGFSTKNNGVFGDSTGAGASGVYGQNDGGGYGVAGRVTKTGFPAVLADAGSTGSDALDATSRNGFAVKATSLNGVALQASNDGTVGNVGEFTTAAAGAGEAFFGNSSGIGVIAEGFASSSFTAPALNATCINGAPAMTASNASADIMSLDCSGNMILAGLLTTSGTPLSERRTAVGSTVGTYSAQQTTQTIEDFGEAQLVGGYAYVSLAADFAATIDRRGRVNYLVFITPQGDSRGLYVTNKSGAGFAVRENGNGRSSLVFDYRIVARPFGEPSRRLPVMQAKLHTDPSVMMAMRQALQAKALLREQTLHAQQPGKRIH